MKRWFKLGFGLLCCAATLFTCKEPLELANKGEFQLPDGFDDRERGESSFRVVFYNLENLFDTERDSTINDQDFTPEGNYGWSDFRYRAKQQNMSKTIAAIGGWELPEIVGVCEIENRRVLEDLIKQGSLKKGNYDIVHQNSPDRRGIDVGLLYRKDKVTLLSEHFLEMNFPMSPDTRTRDVLMAKLLVAADTFIVFVNHWPSRYGGQAQSEPLRIYVAEQIKMHTDSLMACCPNTGIIIMGDFNDEPANISLSQKLGAKKPPENPQSNTLYNLMEGKMNYPGSHKYQGQWAFLDQIIVSGNLLNDEAPRIKNGSAYIFHASWLLVEDTRYPGHFPFRTFSGPQYLGGFSDHLPVYTDIQLP